MEEPSLSEVVIVSIEGEAEHVVLILYLFKVETFQENNIYSFVRQYFDLRLGALSDLL